MTITRPDQPQVAELYDRLTQLGPDLDRTGNWPAEQLALCAEFGVYEWFLDTDWGGHAWSDRDVVLGYLALSSACLTTAFIITQRTGACRRIAGCQNQSLKEKLLPDLASGKLFATVGISHLTTSRRHLAKPVLTAQETSAGFVLDGYSPWVTGATAADYVVVGATLVEHEQPTDLQLLIALPTNLPGVSVPAPAQLAALTGSQTGSVRLDQVEVDRQWLMSGPVENVMASGVGASTGGHETSTLAIGLAGAAVNYLSEEAAQRADLEPASRALSLEHSDRLEELLAHAEGQPDSTKEELRQRANSLALRASQAALSAAKGTGYVVGHQAGRWCREALFFLVWSCPQPVAAANLCELAGIDPT